VTVEVREVARDYEVARIANHVKGAKWSQDFGELAISAVYGYEVHAASIDLLAEFATVERNRRLPLDPELPNGRRREQVKCSNLMEADLIHDARQDVA
jgi:hypothetical protein